MGKRSGGWGWLLWVAIFLVVLWFSPAAPSWLLWIPFFGQSLFFGVVLFRLFLALFVTLFARWVLKKFV